MEACGYAVGAMWKVWHECRWPYRPLPGMLEYFNDHVLLKFIPYCKHHFDGLAGVYPLPVNPRKRL